MTTLEEYVLARPSLSNEELLADINSSTHVVSGKVASVKVLTYLAYIGKLNDVEVAANTEGHPMKDVCRALMLTLSPSGELDFGDPLVMAMANSLATAFSLTAEQTTALLTLGDKEVPLFSAVSYKDIVAIRDSSLIGDSVATVVMNTNNMSVNLVMTIDRDLPENLAVPVYAQYADSVTGTYSEYVPTNGCFRGVKSTGVTYKAQSINSNFTGLYTRFKVVLPYVAGVTLNSAAQ